MNKVEELIVKQENDQVEISIIYMYDDKFGDEDSRQGAIEAATKYLALQARVEALQTAFDAACDYINHSPCDYDITPIQHVKWNIFKDLREAILKGEKE